MVFPCNGRAIIAWPVSRPLPLQCEQLQDGVHDGVLIVRAGDEMGGVLGLVVAIAHGETEVGARHQPESLSPSPKTRVS